MTTFAILDFQDVKTLGPAMDVAKRDAFQSNERLATEDEMKLLQATEKNCSVEPCGLPALVVLGQQPLCLTHFIVRCYEWLDYLDPMIRTRLCVSSELARVQSLVEECSNRALLVSLRCEDLSNLDRSRLLDILLLTSDLLFLLRLPRSESPSRLSYRPTAAKLAAFAPITRAAQTTR